MALFAVLFVAVGLALWFSGAVYHRLVLFPRMRSEIAALQAQRESVPPIEGWNEYQGVGHSHSILSHDCEVPFEDIQRVLERTGRHFICLSDHPDRGLADFSLPWRGLHGGKLFVPGFEMRRGYMPFGVASNVVLTNSTDDAILARQIIAGGGVLFFAHPEEPRDWDRAELTGTEIYNTHADLKDERWGLLKALPEVILNQNRYPDLVLRTIFDRPTSNLRRWDALNRTRPITGIGANDCHQNVGLRIWSTTNHSIRIEDTSPKTLYELRLNRITRWLATILFGRLDPARKLFHVQMDPYDVMAQHVTTHVLARALNEPEILSALRAGRAFVGFDLLVDSSGFVWQAQAPAGRAVMGESLCFQPGTLLRAHAPCACRVTILRDGTPVHQAEGRLVEWPPPGPGVYRVEAELKLAGHWTPWVYANPIRLLQPDPAPAQTPAP